MNQSEKEELLSVLMSYGLVAVMFILGGFICYLERVLS